MANLLFPLNTSMIFVDHRPVFSFSELLPNTGGRIMLDSTFVFKKRRRIRVESGRLKINGNSKLILHGNMN